MYHKHFSTRQTPQSQPIPGREADMARDDAGGFAFPVNDWTQLDRFLVLGSEGGTYYVSEQKLTVRNAQAVQRCIQADGLRVVARTVEISEAGRAPKNNPALFVLAMCCGMGDVATRKAAFDALPRVARIGTHLFTFLEYVKAFRGWGRGLRDAIARWYNDKELGKLAYQVVKYRQRGGWTHTDALRLAHPKTDDAIRNIIYGWITKGWGDDGVKGYRPTNDDPLKLIYAFEKAQRAESAGEIIALVRDHNLPWETIPTQFLKSPRVWEVLLPNLPMTATVRNLARMTMNGLLAPMSDAARIVTERLTNQDALRKARVHPVAILAALITYQSGQSGFTRRASVRRHMSHHYDVSARTWSPVREIVDALDAAFYLSFGNVNPTGKRLVLGLDVSGSMTSGSIAGVPGLTPRIGAAAMALVTANVENQYWMLGFSHHLVEMSISPRQRLDDVAQMMDALPFGRTDCALPMLGALNKDVEADAFIVYTDNETWCGNIHPVQALNEYRRKMGIPAKSVVMGMTSGGFSIADPQDAGMLDVVGFDTATPNLISDFVR